MDPRILGGIGVVVVVVGLVAGALWQANKLIAVGAENGQLKTENAALKTELTTKAEEVAAEIEVLEEQLDLCNGGLTSANFVAATWEARYRELQTNIPSMEAEPIEIISEGCVPALAEGRALAAAEVLRLLQGGADVSP